MLSMTPEMTKINHLDATVSKFMTNYEEPLDLHFASAFVRGSQEIQLPEPLRETPLELLEENELTQIVEIGREAGLKLHRFKKSLGNLARVKRVLGFLHGIAPQSLLDVGSGRGVFLWPFMRTFPDVPTTAMDIDEHRFELYKAVQQGGVERLTPLQGDICTVELPPKSFDVVSILEVLEHLPEPQIALRNAAQLAQRHLVVSVPSREDDNPHHIHLITEEILAKMLRNADCPRFRFDYTLGHLIAFVTL